MLTFLLGFYFGGMLVSSMHLMSAMKNVVFKDTVHKYALVYVLVEHAILWPYYELVKDYTANDQS